MTILGISGKKQSGKTTVGNFILSLYISKLRLADKVYLDNEGKIIVSDFCGYDTYQGDFDIHWLNYVKPDNILDGLNRLNQNIRIYNFADILKQNICMEILGLKYEQCYGTNEQKDELTNMYWSDKQLSCRDVMQVVGTDMFRALDKDVWVRSTINRIVDDRPELAIITDCRFPNEVEAIKKIDGKIIRLTRNPHNSDHTSETILDENNYDWSNFDYVIDNSNLSMYDQVSGIKNILEQILGLN